MSGVGLVTMAVGNASRSLSRSLLTVLAIFIGAFTLTLTTSVGNGINTYIDNTTSAIAAGNTLSVTKAEDQRDGPQKYTGKTVEGDNPITGDVTPITPSDLTALRDTDGVVSAEPVLTLEPDYVVYDGSQKYQLQMDGYVAGTQLQLIAGEQPDPDSKTREIALPEDYVEALDFDNAQEAIDEVVTIGVTDADDKQTTMTATVVAVVQGTLATSDIASVNDTLATALYDRQSVGLSKADKESYGSATVEFASSASGDEIASLQADLSEDGYEAETVDDQIGDFKAVIDGIIWVLNGFAIISLLAAGIGIVNTLLMSVRERTREIGLMKAMGLGGGSIFAMFSLEAVFIGLVGSALGAGVAALVGTVLNGVLSAGLLAALPGLTLFTFEMATILAIIGLVMAISFVAATIPALRAARQDPIDSLRYE